MRVILIAAAIFGSLPLILFLPYLGVLVFSWVSYMNPHRLAWWTFIYDLPVAAIVGAVTILAYLASQEPKKIPVRGITVVWILLVLWMNVTTFFALNEGPAMWEWDRTMKIQLMALLTLAMLVNRQRLDLLAWIIVISIGFYGVKGGLFTLRTGGEYLLWGPRDSFIHGNNEIAFAILVTMPLMRYLQMVQPRKLVRWGFSAAMGLSAIAVLGSYSRGAFLTVIAIGIFLWLKSRHRVVRGMGIAVVAIVGLMLMPAQWFERMQTIQTYEQDESAMGRINAWGFAVNLANARPLVGGGFQTFTEDLFVRYAPAPHDFHDSHSIYFEVLAEQGYLGLLLYLSLAVLTWRCSTRVIRRTRDRADLYWAQGLAAMLQVSLVGYAVGGAFLGLAYFDLLYHLVALSIGNLVLVERRLDQGASIDAESLLAGLKPRWQPSSTREPRPAGATGTGNAARSAGSE